MATYYVDLDVGYTATGTGLTTNNPFNYSQFIAAFESSSSNTYFLRGQREEASTDLNWRYSGNLYPWPGTSVFRLKMQDFKHVFSGQNAPQLVIRNAVLSFRNVTLAPEANGCFLTLVSTFIKCSAYDDVGSGFPVTSLFGSTLIAGSAYSGKFLKIVGQDSIIDIPTASINGQFWTHGHTPQFTKSAVTFNTSACLAPAEFVDCQFNWLPPTWPSWDASKAAFNYLNLSKGFGGVNPISTPPQPGNSENNYISQSTYWTAQFAGTDYTANMWGVRNGTGSKGIGAMDFDPATALSKFSASTAADGTAVTSSVNLDSLVTSIQAAGTDTYFDSTSKIGRVDAFYVHEDGRQNARVIHWATEGFQASVAWTPGDTRDGTWSKVAIKAFDHENAEVTYDNTSVLSTEAITHASGVMSLNTN